MVLIISKDIGKDNDPSSLFDAVVFDRVMTILKATMRNDQEWDKVRQINNALISAVNSWYGAEPLV